LLRLKQLTTCINNILNKLCNEQLNTLKNELFQFLNRQEQTINNQIIRISNEEECLLCLSKLATLILERLFDGDLNDTKTEFFYH
ncbi:unnamed protein product, partial [Rotaria sordida]